VCQLLEAVGANGTLRAGSDARGERIQFYMAQPTAVAHHNSEIKRRKEQLRKQQQRAIEWTLLVPCDCAVLNSI